MESDTCCPVLPDTSAVQVCTSLTRAASSCGDTMKQMRPRRMRETPDSRESDWREVTVERRDPGTITPAT